MKRRLILSALLILSACVLPLTSCNKDKVGNEIITVNGNAAVSMTMDKTGDSKTVVVRGNKSWVAEAADWISVEPTSGEADVDITVTISVGVNTGEERIGGVTFTLPGAEFAEVIVTQHGE
ncbi:MAG: BACON domain-containing protein [Taibaiella sp.]|nr:BACON domain-containing protein [Taibaiella sp.]